MYAELKSQNKLLINRLDENEKILLKNLLEDSKDATITFNELTDETGDFGGIFIEVTPKETTEVTE